MIHIFRRHDYMSQRNAGHVLRYDAGSNREARSVSRLPRLRIIRSATCSV
jgi:hypothetical protein